MLLSPSRTPVITTTSPSPQRPTDAPLDPQVTGSSFAAQYDDVFAQLDALADASSGPQTSPTPTGGSKSRALSPYQTPSQTPTRGRALPRTPPRVFSPPTQVGLHGLGIRTPGRHSPDILETLTERTEGTPVSSVHNPAYLPAKPAAATTAITPSRASASQLIQMFESRVPPAEVAVHGPRSPKTTAPKPASPTKAPSPLSLPVVPTPVLTPKSEPLSVQSRIATWRERTASASDPGQARSWNVSIRRPQEQQPEEQTLEPEREPSEGKAPSSVSATVSDLIAGPLAPKVFTGEVRATLSPLTQAVANRHAVLL